MAQRGTRRLVLVTGAGASRSLGIDRPLPLMQEWGKVLSDALNARATHLAAACGLHDPANGEQFEQALGDLLTWGRSLDLQPRYAALTWQNHAGPNARFTGAIDYARQLWPQIIETVNETLFDEFGLGRVDDEAAEEAYAKLLDVLGVEARGTQLFCATTNYDPSMEVALDRLGEVNIGFQGSAFGTPRLQLERLEPWL